MKCVARICLALFLVATPLMSTSVSADTIRVLAAASLKEALDEQARAFEKRTGDTVVASYAGSNVLARQIEAGAPADLFVSADLEWMDYVAERGLVVPGSRVTLLENSLVLIAPSGSRINLKIAPGFDLASAIGNDRLAMANPESVPAGKYGRSALSALGVWPTVEKRVARAENVRAALALVARGEAPLGIVYRTDALADHAVRIVDTFPEDSYPPILYPAAVIAKSNVPAAKALLQYLRSDSAAGVWKKHGFRPLP